MSKYIEWIDMFLGFFLGIAIMVIILGIVLTSAFNISQETADDICKNLTNDTDAVAKDWEDYKNQEKPIPKGGLVCVLPSYDRTQNIVIKLNSE